MLILMILIAMSVIIIMQIVRENSIEIKKSTAAMNFYFPFLFCFSFTFTYLYLSLSLETKLYAIIHVSVLSHTRLRCYNSHERSKKIRLLEGEKLQIWKYYISPTLKDRLACVSTELPKVNQRHNK